MSYATIDKKVKIKQKLSDEIDTIIIKIIRRSDNKKTDVVIPNSEWGFEQDSEGITIQIDGFHDDKFENGSYYVEAIELIAGSKDKVFVKKLNSNAVTFDIKHEIINSSVNKSIKDLSDDDVDIL